MGNRDKKLRIIKVPFPSDKFEKYKKIVGVREGKFISKDQIKKIFLLALEDFKKGKISSDMLSAISEKLFNFFIKNNEFKKDQDLFFALEAASELSFYIRHPESKNLNLFLKEVLEFDKK